MAQVAILREHLTVRSLMLAIVAAEAAEAVAVAYMVRVGVPFDPELRVDVGGIGVLVKDVRHACQFIVVLSVEGFQRLRMPSRAASRLGYCATTAPKAAFFRLGSRERSRPWRIRSSTVSSAVMCWCAVRLWQSEQSIFRQRSVGGRRGRAFRHIGGGAAVSAGDAKLANLQAPPVQGTIFHHFLMAGVPVARCSGRFPAGSRPPAP